VVVKLGHVAPMTGPQAHLGKDNENGAVLAIEELNAKGMEIGGAKVKFELIAEDDAADPKQGAIVAQKLVDAKVNGVIGHLNSGTTIPASKLYADAGIPQISGSATNPKYTQQGFATAFRVMANDVQQGKVLGEFAVKQGVKTVAIVDDRTAYGQGLADEFKKAAEASGLKVVATEYTNDKATDFKAILTKIKSTKAELVFFGGMDAQGGPMAKQMKELGIKAKFLGGDGVCTPEFMKLGGEASEGNFCSLPGMPLEKLAKGPAFKERFTKKFWCRYPALLPVCLRCGDGHGRLDEARRFGRVRQIPAGNRQDQVRRRDCADRVRSTGRPQGRRHLHLPVQGRQAGIR
jgi:branched-chain amino acid transport system substrate-binding protein